MDDKILADIRNKLTPIKNLIAMLNEIEKPLTDNDVFNKMLEEEIQKSKKCVEYICDIS